jgi:hypothetical protein
MHFVADATVPSASLLFGNHDAFERGCAALAEERRQSRDEGIICQKCRMKVAVIGLERGRCNSCGTALVKKQTPAVVVETPVDPSEVLDYVCDKIWQEGVSESPEVAFNNALKRCTWLAAAVFCPVTPPDLLQAISRLREDFRQRLAATKQPSPEERTQKKAEIEAGHEEAVAAAHRRFEPQVNDCEDRLRAINRDVASIREQRRRELDECPDRRVKQSVLRDIVTHWAAWLLLVMAVSALGALVGCVLGPAVPSLRALLSAAIGILLIGAVLWRLSVLFQDTAVDALDQLVNVTYHQHQRETDEKFEAMLSVQYQLHRKTTAKLEQVGAERREALRQVKERRQARIASAEGEFHAGVNKVTQEYRDRAKRLIKHRAVSSWYRLPEIPPLS